MVTGGRSDQARVEQQIAVTASQKPAAIDRFTGERQQPFLIRIIHWYNAVFVVLMAGRLTCSLAED
jgi:hypothetical protein